MSLPPGPRGPSFFQLLHYVRRPLQFFDEGLRKFGDPFTVRLPGFGAFVMLTSPELIKQVFTGDPQLLRAGKGNEMLAPVVGRHSVLLLDGKEHLRQRRLLLPPFHGERMQAYARLMAEVTTAAVRKMPRSGEFALHPFMQEITLQVILRAVFGLDEGSQMNELAALLVQFMEPPPSLLVFFPPKRLDMLDFPGSPYRTFLARRDRVDRVLREVIRSRISAADTSRTDILSLLLQARDEEGRAMSEDELRDELVTLLVAGHETTATALSWAFAFVLGSPEARTRIAAELDSVRGPDGALDASALVGLEYLDAVIKESMRLRPILPDVVRWLDQPMSIGGYDIPAHTYLAPCIYLAHRRPEAWPDPERFLPERFVGLKVDPYTWFPFGGGIRRCLGMAFALQEMKIVLGITLSETRLRLTAKDPLRVVRRGVTLAPAGGTRVQWQ